MRFQIKFARDDMSEVEIIEKIKIKFDITNSNQKELKFFILFSKNHFFG
jgi:hypothetical protein